MDRNTTVVVQRNSYKNTTNYMLSTIQLIAISSTWLFLNARAEFLN